MHRNGEKGQQKTHKHQIRFLSFTLLYFKLVEVDFYWMLGNWIEYVDCRCYYLRIFMNHKIKQDAPLKLKNINLELNSRMGGLSYAHGGY